MDKLDILVLRQSEFMVSLGKKMDLGPLEKDIETRDTILAIMSECQEVLQHVNWKPWKKTKKAHNTKEIKEEIIDIMHFVLELSITWGMTSQDILDIYQAKMTKNIARQKENY